MRLIHQLFCSSFRLRHWLNLWKRFRDGNLLFPDNIPIRFYHLLFPVYTGSRLLAALCTGIFAGAGYALIYTRNSSTGGGILADQGRVPGFQEHQFPGKRVAVILEEQAVPDEENVAALGTAGFQLIK